MDILWLLLDIIEAIVGFVGLAIALKKKKTVGYVIAISYLLYVFSDAIRVMNIGSKNLWNALLQLAPIVALVAFWMLYKEKKKRR